MKTNRQILLDHTIIKWFAWVLNLLVMAAGKIAPKNHDLSLPVKRIAVCKFKGLGSVIQATPLLHALREKYPDATIIFVSSVSNRSLLQRISLIDEILILDDSSLGSLVRSFFSLIVAIFRRQIDVYIDLEVYSNFSSVVAALSNARNRFGYYLKESNYRMGIYTHMMYYNSAVPISQAYLQWARLLGCAEKDWPLYGFDPLGSRFLLSDKETDLEKMRYLVINPNASDLRIERRWPAASFVSLIQQLADRYPEYRILLIGSATEREYVSGIRQQVSAANVVSVAGETSMDDLIRVIRYAGVVVTNDTGPMHLSFSMKVPTVALFGPCSPAQYGAAPNSAVIYKQVYCSPCVHEFRIPPCMGNNQCMKQIEVAEVLSAVDLLLRGAIAPSASLSRAPHVLKGTAGEVLGIISRKTY